MPRCGSQLILCDLPIRFDTYVGCSHGCKYCFVTRKVDISNIKVGETPKQLEDFINGKRSSETAWCDWNIPLHWGGMSDPFQPIELDKRISLKCLEILAKSKYPVVLSTKNTTILSRPEYLALLRECNAVVQVSAICSLFDKIELGAPKYDKRIDDIKLISDNCKRVIVRIQPYITEAKQYILDNLQRYKDNGVYGITIEGIKYFSKRTGFVKCGGDFVYPVEVLKADFSQIKEACHSIGIKFFSAENRLRYMGDDLCCCGIMRLDDFVTNKANLIHYLQDGKINYTPNMKIINKGTCAFKAMSQSTISVSALKKSSYQSMMDIFSKDKKMIKNLTDKL